MRLTERITHDMTESLKQKDSFRVGVLRMIIAALQNAQIEKDTKAAKTGAAKDPLTDDEALAILSRECKKRIESATELEKGNRSDLAKSERDEAQVIQAYLPAQMSVQELRATVEKIVAGLSPDEKTQWGKVMQALAKELKGKADMQQAGAIARETLGNS